MLIIDSLTGEEISVQYSNRGRGVQLSLVYTKVLKSRWLSDGTSGQPVASTSGLPSICSTSAVHGGPELCILPSATEVTELQPNIPENEVPLEHIAIPVIPINQDQASAQAIPQSPPLVREIAVPDEFHLLVPGRILRPRRHQNVVVQ